MCRLTAADSRWLRGSKAGDEKRPVVPRAGGLPLQPLEPAAVRAAAVFARGISS